jgi:hypothetical protein
LPSPFAKRHGILGQATCLQSGKFVDFQIAEETVVVIVALFAAFLLGIVVGSGLEILVRSRVPSA